jgi:hypothetical protein
MRRRGKFVIGSAFFNEFLVRLFQRLPGPFMTHFKFQVDDNNTAWDQGTYFVDDDTAAMVASQWTWTNVNRS